MSSLKNNFDSTPADDAAFDAMLRRAMQARPEPAPLLDLADRAIRLVKSRQRTFDAAQSRRIAAQRRWILMTGLAAAMLIVAVMIGAGKHMLDHGDLAAVASSISATAENTEAVESSDADATAADAATSEETAVQSTSSDAASESSTSSSAEMARTIIIALVAELLVLCIVLMFITRSGPSVQFGAEALSGFW